MNLLLGSGYVHRITFATAAFVLSKAFCWSFPPEERLILLGQFRNRGHSFFSIWNVILDKIDFGPYSDSCFLGYFSSSFR